MEFKTETEKQISKFGKKKPSDFCKQCVNIKETIIKKDREFKGCLTDRSKQLKLIDVNGEIKDFTDECISVYSQCVQKRLSRDRKLVESKRISEKSCETNGSCKQKISTVPQKNKSSPRLAPEPRSTGSSQRQISQNPRGELENAEQSRQQAVIREDQKDVKGAAITIEAKGEASESVATHHSDLLSILIQIIQGKRVIHVENSLNSSYLVIKIQMVKLRLEIFLIRISLEVKFINDLISKERGDQNPISSSTVIANTEILTPDHVDSFRAGISDSSSDHLTTGDVPSASRSAEEKLYQPEGSHHPPTDNEVSAGLDNNVAATRSEDEAQDVSQVTHRIKNAGGTSPDGGTTCTETQSSELNDVNGNKLDVFSRIFEAISNKEHVIKASAPMGIVLLLGLLFKVN
ncbi:hypothetical protein PVIIG_06341 [Plasmodium vivax India VII]|uniref:VIR protein n=1 Tax=Plasmodium vivax India VII TaxID=1077284 RepID=A0A0J9S1C3_PLAVI|nr:hypothetical protein PVIIG_06341 [Plasmodium vivax India VII]